MYSGYQIHPKTIMVLNNSMHDLFLVKKIPKLKHL